jgi:acetyl/propionyl-CoA carboxylase alpha subunit
MAQALDEYVLLGPRTNLAYLRAIVTHPAFASGDLSTEFLAEHLTGWRAPQPTAEVSAIAAILSDPAFAGARSSNRADRSGGFADPWDRLAGWRIP